MMKALKVVCFLSCIVGDEWTFKMVYIQFSTLHDWLGPLLRFCLR